MTTTRPTLILTRGHHEELKGVSSFKTPLASLATYFMVEDGAPKTEDDMKLAIAVAKELEGVVHSSDIDCDYYPCLLTGADPLDKSFFTAVGIAKGTITKVGGYENPKLEVVAAGKGKGKLPAFAVLGGLGDDELEDLSEYVEEDDLAALKSAVAKLEKLGPIVGVQLCTDDGAFKVVLTLARRESGVHVGVITLRCET